MGEQKTVAVLASFRLLLQTQRQEMSLFSTEKLRTGKQSAIQVSTCQEQRADCPKAAASIDLGGDHKNRGYLADEHL